MKTLVALYGFLGIPGVLIITAIAGIGLYFVIRKYRIWENKKQGKAFENLLKAQRRDEIRKRIIMARESRQQTLLNNTPANFHLPKRELSSVTS